VRRRRVEPWPIAIGLALLFMVGVCISVWAVAQAHPDPVITPSARPGLER
jgi:hypothetical protein